MKHLRLLFLIPLLLGAQLIRAQHPSLVLCHTYTGNATDGSSIGHTSAVKGAVLTADRFGTANRAYYFAPIGGRDTANIEIADHNSLDIGSCFTIMAWVKPDTGFGIHYNYHIDIVSKWGNTGAAYLMALDTNGFVTGYTNNGFGNGVTKSATALNPGVWTHIAMTFDGSRMRYYINGVLDAVRVHTVIPQNSPFPLRIGHEGQNVNGNWGKGFKGAIDEVRIFNRTLVASQVSTVMNLATCPGVNDISRPAFTVQDTVLCIGSEQAVITPGNGITNYFIDWGDSTLNANTSTHTYTRSGSYTIVMYLDTNGLCSDTVQRKVRAEACCELDLSYTRKGCDTFSLVPVVPANTTIVGSYWTRNGVPWNYSGGDTTLAPGSHTLCVYVLAHMADGPVIKNCCMSKCTTINIPVPTHEFFDTTFCGLDTAYRFDGNTYSPCAGYILSSGAGFVYDSRVSGKTVHMLKQGHYQFLCFDANGCLTRLIDMHININPVVNDSCYARLVDCIPPVIPVGVLPVPPNCPGCYTPNPAIRYGFTDPDTISYNPVTATVRYQRFINDSTNCRRCKFTYDVVDTVCAFSPDFNWNIPNPPYGYNFTVSPLANICPGSNITWTITNLATGTTVSTSSLPYPLGMNYSYTFPPGNYRVTMEICVCLCNRQCCKTVSHDFFLTPPAAALTRDTGEKERSRLEGDQMGTVELRIIPNPTSAIFEIRPSGFSHETYDKVEVFANNGTLIQTKTHIPVKHQYNLSAFPAGVYTVKVLIEGRAFNLQVILQD